MSKKTVIITSILLGAALLAFGGGVTPGPVDTGGRALTVAATNALAIQLATPDVDGLGWTMIGSVGGYDLDELWEDNANRGPSRDLPRFSWELHTTNVTVSWTAGDIYDPYTSYHHLDAGSHPLVSDGTSYAYWSTNDYRMVQWTTGARPDNNSKIYLGTWATAFTNILHGSQATAVGDELLYEDVAFAGIFPSLITDGILAYATATNLTNIVLSGGTEYHDLSERITHPTISLAVCQQLTYYGHSAAGTWSKYQTNRFPLNICDTGTTVSACNPNSWYRGVFVAPVDTTNHLHFVLPDNVYTSLVDALAGTDPDMPTGFDPYVPRSTAYIYMGSDTCLRTAATYWQDDRFMIRRGNAVVTSTGGGTTPTPTIGQVLSAGHAAGGAPLMDGLGFPVNDDQVSSKGYADSLKNKSNTGSAYVDPINGDDVLGRIEKSSLPFKTITAAINACAAAASGIRRFMIMVSIGTYVEDPVMKNFVSVRGLDIESTIVRGQFIYPEQYTDLTGGELSTLSIYSTNKPAILFRPGVDKAYSGARSCAVYTTWTNGAAVMPTYQIERGQFQVYATTWSESDVPNQLNTNGVVCIYYGTTNSSNLGAYYLDDFGGTHTINCVDTNVTISTAYSDAAQDSSIQLHSCQTDIWLDDSTNHANKVKLLYMKGGNGSIDSWAGLKDMHLDPINSVTAIAVASEGSAAARLGSGVHGSFRMRCPNIKYGHNFIGSATTTNDYVEAYNTQLAPQTTNYPARYTADGALGTVVYAIEHGGDLLISGGLELSQDDGSGILPAAGHGKLYTQTTSGFENPYWQDSAGMNLRIFRDSARTMYNAAGVTMTRGQAVYVTNGISSTANYCKLASANTLGTMPCFGMVASASVAPGAKGRIFVNGRIETGLDTSYMTAGQPIYLSDTVDGGFTNVAPTAGYVQRLGYANVIGVSGSVLIDIGEPDTLGNQKPSYYASGAALVALDARVVTETNRAQVAESALTSGLVATTNYVNSGLGAAATTNGNNFAATTNYINIAATQYQGRVSGLEGRTSTWNTASLNASQALTQYVGSATAAAATSGVGFAATTNYINSGLGAAATTNGNNFAATTNAINIAATQYQGRVSAIEGRTSTWNQASVDAINATNLLSYYHTPRRFKANIGTANITYGTGLAVVPFTNLVLSATGGSIYSNGASVAQWWPKATNGVVKLAGSYSSAFANNKAIDIEVWKNGAVYTSVFELAATAQSPGTILTFTWNFVDTATPTVNDYYQIYLTETTGYLTRQAGTNNWWYGEVTSY